MRSRLILRARILSACFILLATLLVARLYFVQIVHGGDYERSAVAQYVESHPDTDDRGAIYFTDKSGELISAAVMQTGWRIALVPKDVADAARTYDALNAITPIDRERFMASAGKTDDPYEEVAFRVPEEAGPAIRALKLPGVLLVQDQWRFYPGNRLAAGVLGFVGYRSDRREGLYGLERSWQDTLVKISDGLYVNPFAEIFINVRAALSADPSKEHGSIIASIEPSVQERLESTLDDVVETYTPVVAGGIVMDPHTGEIVAMATRPTFDPNTYNTVSNISAFGNPLVEGRYELGSIMKALTMAAGLDSGAVSPTTTYNDTGCIERSGKTICNFDHKARRVVPMQEVLNQSLNTGATFVADSIGHERFTRYLKAYQLDQKTGIDLPGEVSGDLSTIGSGHEPDVEYASASFGQGIASSPIEMVRALSALANGGVLPSPHVVKAVRYDSGIVRAIPIPEGPRVLSTTTAETISAMLTTVFDTALLKGALKQEHYSIAAKTGTAQIANPNGGGYYADRYLHSFFGYFPAHDPKFIVFLFAVEPHGVEYASASLAHPFADIASFLIHYYDIPPDR